MSMGGARGLVGPVQVRRGIRLEGIWGERSER